MQRQEVFQEDFKKTEKRLQEQIHLAKTKQWRHSRNQEKKNEQTVHVMVMVHVQYKHFAISRQEYYDMCTYQPRHDGKQDRMTAHTQTDSTPALNTYWR